MDINIGDRFQDSSGIWTLMKIVPPDEDTPTPHYIMRFESPSYGSTTLTCSRYILWQWITGEHMVKL